MLSFLHWANRNWRSFRPAKIVKRSDALRLGIIGASNIAPIAVILPAKSHPEVLVTAVAARDENRARAYAKSHGIPNVRSSYQDLLDDPTIDAVYIALPNGLHYEWAIKALKAGKHVLLEKPSTSNSIEARRLFCSPPLTENRVPSPPVLLEAVHVRFHPAWHKFLSLIDASEIAEATATHVLPKGFFRNDDIRFNYDLAGGCLMDLGYYSVQLIRQVFGNEPVECVNARARRMPGQVEQNIDQAFSATWRFPNGGIGHTIADTAATGGHYFPWLTHSLPSIQIPMCSVRHRERLALGKGSSGTEEVVTKTVVAWGLLFASLWHRIDVIEDHVLRNTKDRRVIKRWTEKLYFKQYESEQGDDSWTTYRHQLEQFVNAVRGRSTRAWIDSDDSIRQMEMIDKAYEKVGMPLRPLSSFKD